MAKQISKRNKCIFIHVPKAAGSSIEESEIFEDQKQAMGEPVRGHMTALRFRELWPNEFASYFKFTFVRNPYSRLVSAFNYTVRGNNATKKAVQAVSAPGSKTHLSFAEFCRTRLSADLIDEVVHFRHQHRFICDQDRNLLVDFIGRQESFVRDAKEVYARLGLPYEHRHSRRIGGKQYSSHYTKQVQDKVFSLYAEDFELLGYPYEIESVHPAIYFGQQRLQSIRAFQGRWMRRIRRRVSH